MFFEPAGVQALRGDLADLRSLLADEAEGAVGFPLVLARLVDVDRDAGRDGLLDVGVDDAGDEVADDDGVGLLGDGDLHGARRGRLDVGLVDGDVVELDAESLGRVLRPLIKGGKNESFSGPETKAIEICLSSAEAGKAAAASIRAARRRPARRWAALKIMTFLHFDRSSPRFRFVGCSAFAWPIAAAGVW